MSSSTTLFPFILSTAHKSGDLFNLICLFLTLLIISLCFIIASKQKTNKKTPNRFHSVDTTVSPVVQHPH